MASSLYNLNQSQYNVEIINSIFKEFVNYTFKDLIISKCIMQSITYLVNSDTLATNGFSNIYRLENIDSTTPRVCSKAFIIQPDLQSFKASLAHCSKILSTAKDDQKKKIKIIIFIIPHVDDAFYFLLEEEGLWDLVKLCDLPITHFQFDSDCYGLMSPLDFQFFTNSTILSLNDIFEKFGPIPNIYAFGSQSRSIIEFAEKNIRENFNYFDEKSSTHGYLFLFDRSLDWRPLFLSSLNFESVLSHHYSNSFGVSRLISKRHTDTEQFIMTGLNNFDPLFNELRSLAITEVNGVIVEKMKQFQESHLATKNMIEMNKSKNVIVNRLNDMKIEEKSLDIFLSSTVRLLKILQQPINQKLLIYEDEISNKTDYKISLDQILELCSMSSMIKSEDVIRLICLLALHYPSKFTTSDLSKLVKDFIACRGINYLNIFHTLSSLNILPTITYSNPMRQEIDNPPIKPQISANSQTNLLAQGASILIDKIYTKNPSYPSFDLYSTTKALRKKISSVNSSNTQNYETKNTFRSEYVPLLVELVKYWVINHTFDNISTELNKLCGDNLLVIFCT
ncbi:MAG: Vacuolar protein sorting-associated protein 33B, variant 2 [Marteilia pararefringens]